MENFIKECKNGFDMDYVSSSSQIVNANRMQIHAMAYNLFNWFRRLMLPNHLKKDRINTIRLKLFKIAARVVRSSRYIYFKLCSSCPFQKEFFETMRNIRTLRLLEQISLHLDNRKKCKLCDRRNTAPFFDRIFVCCILICCFVHFFRLTFFFFLLHEYFRMKNER